MTNGNRCASSETTDGTSSMGRVEGKVAFITGAARGQGRSHAIRLAEEGADIIAVDICQDVASATYPMATPTSWTRRPSTSRRPVDGWSRPPPTCAIRWRCTVRPPRAHRTLGRLDVVVANAGICTLQPWDEVTPEVWKEIIDINLTGVWNTCFVTAPTSSTAGGGAMILISSTAGLKGQPFLAPYVAAKHGRRRHHARAGQRAGRARHQGQHHPSHRGRHPLARGLYSTGQPARGPAPTSPPSSSNTLPVETLDPRISPAPSFTWPPTKSKYVTGLDPFRRRRRQRPLSRARSEP